MKKIITIFAVTLLTYVGYSQQLIQNISDIHRLKDNEAVFINKPLKDLLKEIKPEIKVAFAFNDDPSYFEFRFITTEQRRKKEGNKVSLFVDVKDLINWNWEQRPKGRETIWTREDAERYGELIVSRIGIVY